MLVFHQKIEVIKAVEIPKQNWSKVSISLITILIKWDTDCNLSKWIRLISKYADSRYDKKDLVTFACLQLLTKFQYTVFFSRKDSFYTCFIKKITILHTGFQIKYNTKISSMLQSMTVPVFLYLGNDGVFWVKIKTFSLLKKWAFTNYMYMYAWVLARSVIIRLL